VNSSALTRQDSSHILSVTRVVVRADRIMCRVQVGDLRFAWTSPDLLGRLLVDHPHLAQHSCVNATGDVFGSVMNETSLPHLFEHVVVDILAAGSDNPEQVFTGTTRWVDEQAGIAHVELSFADDIEAFRAINRARDEINAALTDMCKGAD